VIARLAAAAAALLLAGCAAFAPEEAPLPSLAAVPTSFEMSGRLAVHQGNRSDIAVLRWTRRGHDDTWVIASPLGNEVARIDSTPAGATLHEAGGDTEEASSFEALTRKVLGVGLDPAWLAEGLHGKAPSGLPDGWQFSIDETQPAGAVRLARRITVRKDDTVVRLVVDSYRALDE
jgi:outer membrane biogenesis lipoprotein LolB